MSLETTAAGQGPDGARLFSPLTALALVAAAILSAAAFLVLSAFAPDLRNTGNGRAHALSTSAVGYAGLLELLRGEGGVVVVRRNLTPESHARDQLLILTPETARAPQDRNAITSRNTGPVLIVPPKWIAAPHRLHRGWVAKVGLQPSDLVSSSVLKPLTDATWDMSSRTGKSRPVLAGGGAHYAPETRIQLGEIDQFRSFDKLPEGWASALVDEQGRTVLARMTDKEVYLLSDPDFLNNLGLAQRDNAVAAMSLTHTLDEDDTPVVFDVSLNGFGRSRDMLRLLFEPPFLSATLCAFAAGLLMGLHAAVRFGAPKPAERAVALGKRALAETSAALIRMGGREPAMAPRYAALTRDWTARRIGMPRDLDEAAAETMLDRIGRLRGAPDSFSAIAADARAARHEAALMQTARRLYRWRLEMTRGRS